MNERMTDEDLLTLADRVVRSYFDGSDRSKIDLRQAMTDLRVEVNAELKRKAQAETAMIIKPTGLAFGNSTQDREPIVTAPPMIRPPPFTPGNQPHG